MYILLQFVGGIAAIHAVLLLAYLCGSVLQPRTRESDDSSPAISIVISTGLGIAAIGFLSFFVGIAGLLSPLGFIAILVVIAGCGWWTKQYVWKPAFWVRSFRRLGLAFGHPGLQFVWLLCLVLAVPAAQPPTAFDALFFHQVYALEWAQHHAIYVDVFRRFPWYAQNWILIYAWFDRFHLRNDVQFLNWAAYALSAVLVYGLTKERLPGRPRLTEAAAAAAPLPFLFAPIFIRWADTGMVDAALGFFFLLSVVVAARSIVQTPPVSWFSVTLIVGFLVGMKPTLFTLLPLFALFIALALRKSGSSWRKVIVALVALVVFSSPWYVKNLIQDGDPVPPAFNYLLHHQDGSYSREDVDAIRSASFFTSSDPISLLTLPVRMFLDPMASDFQEFGTSAETLFLGVPFLVLVIGLWRKRYGETTYWACALVYVFAYWIMTTHLGRYAMLFYPLLTAFNARILIAGSRRAIAAYALRDPVLITSVVAGVGSLVLSLPSPTSFGWLQQQFQLDYVNVDTTFSSKQAFLQKYPGYNEEETISAWLDAHPAFPKRVYAFRSETLAYYFAEHGVESFGDWIGPARYGDLDKAIADGTAAAYLQRLNVSAIMVPETNELLKLPSLRSLGDQLTHADFHSIANADNYDVYVRDP